MLATLYKYDSKGKVRQWRTWTEGSTVFVESGLQDGKKVVKTYEALPKNVGRANATTAEEQAILEAKSKWSQQKDKNYGETLGEANQLENPMLAHPYEKKKKHVSSGWLTQPKLDGVRCLTKMSPEGSEVIYKSRGNKLYQTLGHLDKGVSALLQELPDGTLLDGEIYCHGLPLNEINAAVKKENETTPILQYWVYDLYIPSQPDLTYVERSVLLGGAWIKAKPPACIKNTPTGIIDDLTDIKRQFASHIENGFEGIMLRDPKGVYTLNQRSAGLLKYKEFDTTEFLIVERLYDKDGLLVLECETTDIIGTFTVVPKGGVKYRKELDKQTNLVGKYLTVQHQGWGINGSPIFPVGVAIRETDDSGKFL